MNAAASREAYPVGVALIAADSAVAELIAADHAYDEARRVWDSATAGDPDALSEESWHRIATRFEEACLRRIAALNRCDKTIRVAHKTPSTTAAATAAHPTTD